MIKIIYFLPNLSKRKSSYHQSLRRVERSCFHSIIECTTGAESSEETGNSAEEETGEAKEEGDSAKKETACQIGRIIIRMKRLLTKIENPV